MFRIVSVLTAGLWLILFVVGCSPSANNTDSTSASEHLIVAGSGRPMLVDLGADECVPCKLMKPILNDLTEEYQGRMDVVFIDVWKNRDQATRFNVRLIPTQIFYNETGEELFRRSGFIGKEDILATWRQLGYTF